MTIEQARPYRRIAVVALVAVLVAVGVVGYLSLGPRSQTETTMMTTAQNDFTLNGPVPLITITPENDTFTLNYSATTLSSPVTALSFSLNQSRVTIYTNGTEWVPSVQACSSSFQSIIQAETATTQSYSVTSVATVTGTPNPCNVPPGPDWLPTNGSTVAQYVALNSSQVELSVSPPSVAANTTTSLEFTVTVNMKPGVYVLWLALGVQTSGYFEYSDLNAFPVVVEQPQQSTGVVATSTVTETLTSQASQPTTTYAIPTTSCTLMFSTVTTTTTITVGPTPPTSTTTTTVTTTSTSYTQTITVTSCTYSASTVTSTVTTTVNP